MSRLEWDKTGEKLYQTGVDKGVIYPYGEGGYENGAAWNGLTAVNENPSGAEPTNLYADNVKYLALMSAEEFGFTIEAYMYPDEFAACDGSAELGAGVQVTMQKRKTFGFSYRTLLGNDTLGTSYGYKIHVVYGCLASPSGKENGTVNENPDAAAMSWEVNTTPVAVTGFDPTAHLIIDSTKVTKEKLQKLEDALWGSAEGDAKLLMPDEIKAILDAA